MQQRIEHLETLVKGLLSQQQYVPKHSITSTQDSPESGTESTDTAVASEGPDVEFSPGTTVFDGTYSVYKGTDDWHDVLKEVCIHPKTLRPLFPTRDCGFPMPRFCSQLTVTQINSLKSVWNQTQNDQPNFDESSGLSNNVDGSGLLFGQVKQIERFEILASFPSKPEIDKLLRQFFDQASFPINVARE